MFEEFEWMIKSHEAMEESTVDFPSKSLDPKVWKPQGDSFVLRSNVKSLILNLLEEYPEQDLLSIAKAIRIVGSIGTNQYTPTSDIDVHVTVKDGTNITPELQKAVLVWSGEKNVKVGEHPVEIYLQDNPAQDLMSDGCYDVNSGVWCAGPTIVADDHDPYTEFADIFDDLRSSVSGADELFGELRRDTLDHKALVDAMKRMDPDQREKFKSRLESKLQEIEDDIKELYSEKDQWVAKRRDASKPATPEEALNDVEKAKRWRDTNAEFKFINRYNYLRVINDLQDLLDDDGEITDDDVDQVRDLMKDMV